MKRANLKIQKNTCESRCDFPSEHLRTAKLPIIPDDRWAFYHGTEKIIGGALKGETACSNRLTFFCSQCKNTLRTHLVGVSDDFTGWKPNGPNSDRCPISISVWSVYCPDCGLSDHFKFPNDQHGMFWTGDPLPHAQSHRVSLATALTEPVIPVIRKEDLDPITDKFCQFLQAEPDTDYLCVYCPQCGGFMRGGGSRMVAAVRDSESKPRQGNLISISEFLFEMRCESKCGFVGNFLIPVIGQTLRLCAQ